MVIRTTMTILTLVVGTTQWEQPMLNRKLTKVSVPAPTAGSYDKLKKFMKAKSKHHEVPVNEEETEST